jgi:hypothetical protein
MTDLRKHLPILARYEGIWESDDRSNDYEPAGNKTDESRSRLVCRFPEDGPYPFQQDQPLLLSRRPHGSARLPRRRCRERGLKGMAADAPQRGDPRGASTVGSASLCVPSFRSTPSRVIRDPLPNAFRTRNHSPVDEDSIQ